MNVSKVVLSLTILFEKDHGEKFGKLRILNILKEDFVPDCWRIASTVSNCQYICINNLILEQERSFPLIKVRNRDSAAR